MMYSRAQVDYSQYSFEVLLGIMNHNLDQYLKFNEQNPRINSIAYNFVSSFRKANEQEDIYTKVYTKKDDEQKDVFYTLASQMDRLKMNVVKIKSKLEAEAKSKLSSNKEMRAICEDILPLLSSYTPPSPAIVLSLHTVISNASGEDIPALLTSLDKQAKKHNAFIFLYCDVGIDAEKCHPFLKEIKAKTNNTEKKIEVCQIPLYCFVNTSGRKAELTNLICHDIRSKQVNNNKLTFIVTQESKEIEALCDNNNISFWWHTKNESLEKNFELILNPPVRSQQSQPFLEPTASNAPLDETKAELNKKIYNQSKTHFLWSTEGLTETHINTEDLFRPLVTLSKS